MRLEETDHPLLYEINTRVWVKELAQQSRRRTSTLADVPDSALDEIARLNFDLVWLMGVWQCGEVGEAIARLHPNLEAEYRQTLPDLTPQDVIGSPYAVQDYRVSRRLGGPAALGKLRRRLAQRGIGLILDFVPNHTARDHPWVFSHPEFYVHGDEEALRREPQNFFSTATSKGTRILAHGRDPYFPGWSDTAQVNYQHPGLRAAMIETLLEIAGQCDGVRCDMAMLDLNEIFARTWGQRATPADGAAVAEGEFWPAAIDAVRRRYPGLIFMAEAYWGLEGELQALGFDYTYDKGLYDQLVHGDAGAVRDHLRNNLDFQVRSVRFLENHDEPRAAQLFSLEKHRAAALVCSTLPGMRFLHEGQVDGRKVRVPVQLGRRPREPQDKQIRSFYERLLDQLGSPILRRGRWKALEPRPGWEGNESWQQFVIHRWEGDRRGSCLAVANLGGQQAQCYVTLDLSNLRRRKVLLRDLLSEARYERDADSLSEPGLYLDMAPYQVHLFAIGPQEPAQPQKPQPSRRQGRGSRR